MLSLCFAPDGPSEHYRDVVTVEYASGRTTCIAVRGRAWTEGIFVAGGDETVIPISDNVLGVTLPPAGEGQAEASLHPRLASKLHSHLQRTAHVKTFLSPRSGQQLTLSPCWTPNIALCDCYTSRAGLQEASDACLLQVRAGVE